SSLPACSRPQVSTSTHRAQRGNTSTRTLLYVDVQPGMAIGPNLIPAEAIFVGATAERSPYRAYEQLDDETIVEYVREGDQLALEYLITKYRNFVRAKARSYFLIGADREDIIQEGMIGLYKAIRDFKADKLASFRAFAELCITRQIITAIRSGTRQRHLSLTSYVSLNKPNYDDESDRTLMDVMDGNKVSDPDELVIIREKSLDIEKRMSEFRSELEWKVLMYYLERKS